MSTNNSIVRAIPSALFILLFSTTGFAQHKTSALTITPLTGDFYIYTTYNSY